MALLLDILADEEDVMVLVFASTEEVLDPGVLVWVVEGVLDDKEVVLELAALKTRNESTQTSSPNDPKIPSVLHPVAFLANDKVSVCSLSSKLGEEYTVRVFSGISLHGRRVDAGGMASSVTDVQ